MTIEVVLFDADGVVQYPSMSWREEFQKVLGVIQAPRVDEFMKAVFDAEERPLVGQGDFPKALATVLEEWKCQGSVNDALRVWTMIEPYRYVIHAIQQLRRSGVRCCLASNQQSHRATHMSRVLKYSELFDREFYSCEIGAKKPDGEYFLRVIQELNVTSRKEVLFLDDHEVNVVAAKNVGLHAATYEGKTGAQVLWKTLAAFEVRVP